MVIKEGEIDEPVRLLCMEDDKIKAMILEGKRVGETQLFKRGNNGKPLHRALKGKVPWHVKAVQFVPKAARPTPPFSALH